MLIASFIDEWILNWMPQQASTKSESIDYVFYWIYWVSVVAFLAIGVLMFWFAYVYKAKDPDALGEGPTHSTALEVAWTLPPTVAVLAFFAMGFVGYRDISVPPSNTYQIVVTGYKWGWSFQYPNGYSDANLHVPAGRPVELILQSQDVIHSVFIPDFRVKKDCVPGRYNKLWFETDFDPEDAVELAAGDNTFNVNEHVLFCTEYCGNKHSQMLAQVYVHTPENFAAWLESAADITKVPPIEAGEALTVKSGCLQCHSVDGTSMIGPSFLNLYNKEGQYTTGESYVADANCIRESILYPGAHIVAGYQNVMPSYKGRLKDVELFAIIEYLKSISDLHQETAATDWAAIEETPAE
ncbi:c-type cytochrome [Mucisphaera sp.]|uniref:c-type cytochrome n=1 Tax=Mucisphaera sp. TaxID=2913024 RepID=UPI003D0E17F0